MAIFFSRFCLSGDQSDCYTRLLRALGNSNLLPRTRIASLNYECLIEYATGGLGLRVQRFGVPESPTNVVILKPHGSCNFLPHANFIGGMAIGGRVANYEGPVEEVNPSEVETRYAEPGPLGLLPAMSVMAPGKPNYYAPTVTQQAMREWAAWLREADVCIVIGARPWVADAHVWGPILNSSCRVWCVSGTNGDYEAVASAAGDRWEYLGNRFAEALPTIEDRLQLHT
jgi:hypothetical protein